MRFASLLLLCCLYTASGYGQVMGSCGTQDLDLITQDLLENKRIYAEKLFPRSATKYVPVTFHLVADDNGNGRLVEENILAQLCSLNELYEDQDLTFFIDEWSYKDLTVLYNTPTHPTSQFQMTTIMRDDNAANVFVLNSAENGGNTPGQTLGYYSRPNDHIVIRKDQTNGFSGTLGHEFGHFFSLLHTFNGWDCEAYDEETHGNPLNSQWAPCPSSTNGLSVQAELQDRSNCNTGGDYLCDTPADYNFGFGWSVGGDQCAPFTENIKDFNGDIVDPMENNIMGYFIGCDDYEFTPDQAAMIETDYFKPQRAYLRTGNVPNLGDVTNAVTFIEPINDETTATFDNVFLDWENVPNADFYLVMIDRLPGFTFQPQRFIVSQSNLTLDNLEAEKRYYWRIYPFNASRTCAGWSVSQSFFTSVSSPVKEISAVNDVQIYPNPTSGRDYVTLQLITSNEFDAEVSILNLQGVEMKNYGVQNFIQGTTSPVRLSVADFSAGIYLLHIKSDEGVLTRKLAIQ